jgi:ABC-type polysaccharide/polyol phosphate export permease
VTDSSTPRSHIAIVGFKCNINLVACLCLRICTCAVLAYFVAAMSPNMDVANAALPVYVSTLLFFGGFLFTFDAMPPWWKWYSYINPLRCVVAAMRAGL